MLEPCRTLSNRWYILSFVILLWSCSNLDKRIELLERELDLKLPENYEVVQDDDISFNGLESDYSLIVTLKFESQEFDTVIQQIKLIPYFNELESFRRQGSSLTLVGDEIEQYERLKEEFKSLPYRGSWTSIESGFQFVDLGNKHESVDAWINTENKTLKFEFIHL